jgi:hypothetical protein
LIKVFDLGWCSGLTENKANSAFKQAKLDLKLGLSLAINVRLKVRKLQNLQFTIE